jgi:hypothetical protein
MNEAATTIEFKTGQAVLWPPAPGGLAQIVELRRSTVRLFYRCRSGLVRLPIVNAFELHRLQSVKSDTPPLGMRNALGRGCLPRSKTFSAR